MREAQGSSIVSNLDLMEYGLLNAATNWALVFASLLALAAIGLFAFGYVKASIEYRAAKAASMVKSGKQRNSVVSNTG